MESRALILYENRPAPSCPWLTLHPLLVATVLCPAENEGPAPVSRQNACLSITRPDRKSLRPDLLNQLISWSKQLGPRSACARAEVSEEPHRRLFGLFGTLQNYKRSCRVRPVYRRKSRCFLALQRLSNIANNSPFNIRATPSAPVPATLHLCGLTMNLRFYAGPSFRCKTRTHISSASTLAALKLPPGWLIPPDK